MEQASQIPEWAASLPDEIKPIIQTKGWKSPADIIGSYTNLEKTLGQKRLPAPSADWKDDQWNGLWKELGRPEKPDDYKVPDYKFPDGVQIDEAKMAEAKKALHGAGLLPNQAEKVLKYYFETISKEATGAFEARKREQEAAEFKLRDEWKGDYDNNLKLAKDAFVKLVGDEEAVKRLNETGLGNDPVIVKMFHKLGTRMLEDKAQGRADQGGSNTADSAKAKIEKMKGDVAFMNKLTSGDKDAIKEWNEAWAANPYGSPAAA